MSNAVVGAVYEQVIEDVISMSRVDFEENGVDESVLESLRQGWQRKLTQFNVASFPWDPKPDPEAAAAAAAASAAAVNGGVGGGAPGGGMAAGGGGMGLGGMGMSGSLGGGMGGASDALAPPLQGSMSSQGHSYAQPTMGGGSGGGGGSAMSSQGLPGLPMPSYEAAPPPMSMPMPMPATSHGSSSSSSSHLKTEDGPVIKLEPDTYGGAGPSSGMPPFPTLPGGGDKAAARAMQKLQNTFGQRATASINAIHSGINQPNHKQQQQQQQQHYQQQQQQLYQQQQQRQQMQQQQQQRAGQQLSAQQYRAQVAAQTAAQLNGANAPNGYSNSQVDGSADRLDSLDDASPFEGMLVRTGRAGEAATELGRVEIDALLHAQMARRARQMEGGGLMVPLQQVRRRPRGAEGGGDADQRRRTAASRAQVDGPDDDELDTKEGILDEDDEDAINSDLDDPDENREEDDGDDDMMGPIMLCVYDKVQRVKNKWKCTLKDGVLTVNGKEYVFHKATGEYEW